MNPQPDQQLASAFIDQHESLAPLAERAALLIAMRRLYKACVPAGISGASEVANVRRGVVVINTENSAAAAKIKQLSPRLIGLFLEKGWQVSAIQVQVQGRA